MRLPIKNKSVKGFTIVELLIVIAIIGILAGVLILLIDPVTQFQKGRDANRKTSIRQIQAALEFYRSEFGGYPDTNTTCPYPTTCGGVWQCAGSTGGMITLMQKVPCDPSGNANSFLYSACPPAPGSPNTQYDIRGCMEYSGDANDPNGVSTPVCAPLSCGKNVYSVDYTNP